MSWLEQEVEISSRDYWFKVVEMLQQNWALIDSQPDGSCVVYFIGDTSGVFDQLTFDSIEQAIEGLSNNGFSRYEADERAKKFIAPPVPPFRKHEHPNGPIYSSGRFWR